MFCSECGSEAAGKFCWSCGKPLRQTAAQTGDINDDGVILLTEHWSELTDCQALLAVPEVRARIERHAALSKTKFSGEDFLECCDSLLSPLTGGVPLTLIAKFAQPISEKLGLKTGKKRQQYLNERLAVAIVSILCSLAQNGQKLLGVEPTDAGCMLRATIPSDIWSIKGELLIAVRSEAEATLVEADVTIAGQIYDWGKSNRVLNRLFSDLNELSKAA